MNPSDCPPASTLTMPRKRRASPVDCASGRVRPVAEIVTTHVQAAARERDDDHVGTEHILLALYRSDDTSARDVLERCGVTEPLLRSVIDHEPGPSPDGPIPYTTRAAMIGGLAVEEADRTDSPLVEPIHLLLGAIRESERWAALHDWGPLHLEAAAEAAGTTLAAIEQEASAR